MNKNQNYISIFDIFKIGIGPSSSHTCGPMLAANKFIKNINNDINDLISINIELFGSLSYTGYGHKINNAIIAGLSGYNPENVLIADMEKIARNIHDKHILNINDFIKIDFNISTNIKYNKQKTYDFHSNAILFKANFNKKATIEKIYFSIGGGFVIEDHNKNITNPSKHIYAFNSGQELLKLCSDHEKNIFNLVLENEYLNMSKKQVHSKILNFVKIMNDCIKDGIQKEGEIDNILRLNRKAKILYNNLRSKEMYDPLEVLDWVNIFAIAVCEENASGSKVVTAPTNGAAGIIPAIIRYYQKFIKGSTDEGVINFIATASAIGMLFKINSSISGAEVGCQGEVGVACSMAAAGLTAALGGTPEQIENAAEIAMEHNLGLTCDPVKGLVQIPCIERNSMGAIKAINASRLSLNSDNNHKVSLDQVIKTMNETGKSMNKIFKETSLGGLAVNVSEC